MHVCCGGVLRGQGQEEPRKTPVARGAAIVSVAVVILLAKGHSTI